MMQPDDILLGMLMYFVLPVWLAAGFADYLCHRASHIELTSGWRESLLHLLQFGEMALPILAAMFLENTSAGRTRNRQVAPDRSCPRSSRSSRSVMRQLRMA